MTKPENSQNLNEIPPDQAMLQMIVGPWVSQAIYVAAKLGIADLLKDGPKTSDELANATGTHARSLHRVLRALASVGVFTLAEDFRYSLTPLAECLLTDVPGSLYSTAVMFGEEWHWRPLGEMLHTVKTGEPAFDRVFGMELFPYMGKNAEAAKIFDAAMTSLSARNNAAIPAAYNFSPYSKLVEVSGGQGTLTISILKANPGLKGILFDQPSVIEGAKSAIEAQGLGDRLQLASGNFFESVPSGGDIYMLKNIIHDWDDDRSIAILKNCHSAMVENGKLLVIEMALPSGNEPSFGKLADLEMLVSQPGWERTEAEYRDLFKAAGFHLTKIVPTASPLSAIEGVRV